jgi:hypothetical protein
VFRLRALDTRTHPVTNLAPIRRTRCSRTFGVVLRHPRHTDVRRALFLVIEDVRVIRLGRDHPLPITNFAQTIRRGVVAARHRSCRSVHEPTHTRVACSRLTNRVRSGTLVGCRATSCTAFTTSSASSASLSNRRSIHARDELTTSRRPKQHGQ